jgi:hypothetical protein
LVDFHGKGIQDRRQNRVTRESESTDEEIPKADNLSILRGRDLFVKWGSPSARGKNPAASYSRIRLVVTLDSPKTRGWQRSYSLCLNQIANAGIHIPDIFVIVHSNLSILVTPGAARRTYIFSWCTFSAPSTIGSTGIPAAMCSLVVMGLAVLLTRAT